MTPLQRIFCLLITGITLHGCAAPLLVAGGAAGATLANDRRTPSAFIDDQKTEARIHNLVANDKILSKDSHISVTSFNGIVLLTGQVLHQSQRDRIAALMKDQRGIKRLHNEIQVAAPTSMQSRSRDSWLTTKVKSALLRHKTLNALQVKVVTENDVVYLMGLVTRAEGSAAAAAVQQVSGVRGVIKVFEYLD